jgi:hypothetical protein
MKMNSFALDDLQNTNVSNFTNSEDAKNDLLKNYVKPGHPLAFSGVGNIYNYYNGKLTHKQILDILSSIESYTLHKNYRSGQRNPTFSHFKRYMFQMDLVFFKDLAEHNDGVQYILTVIDTFTRYAWVRMLKDKTGETVLNAFQSILEQAGEKPIHLIIDRGTEFNNTQFSQFCAENHIKLDNPDSSIHAAFIERFNRTLQSLIYRYLSEHETRRFVGVLSQLVATYNNRYHRMIGTSPHVAETDPTSHLDIRMKTLRYHDKIKQKPVTFNIGDTVRIAKLKTKFSRGYTQQMQDELFKVKHIKTNNKIPMYTLETYNGDETLKGNFYSYELIKINTDVFRVEKVLKRRTNNGVPQLYVKWKGFKDLYNSWINSADIKQIF